VVAPQAQAAQPTAVQPAAPAAPANPAAPATGAAAAPAAGNATNATKNAEATDNDSPPYLPGSAKILVYGFFIFVIYLLVWCLRLPAEKRPTAVDEGLMRWVEDQEEQDPTGAVNCVLVRINGAKGLMADKLPAAVEVECGAWGKWLKIGQTSFLDDADWETCFLGPLMDQDRARIVTLQNGASPQVKFMLKYQKEGEEKPTDFAQAIMKPGAASSSSSSSGAAGGGMTYGAWCTQELPLEPAGSAMGFMKRGLGVSTGSLGSINVEVKPLNVNAAGKALLKSNYYLIALRNDLKKPYSACARALAVATMVMLTITSLPIIGDMFSGCFWLSVHGLTVSSSLFLMSIPHFAKLFQMPLPSWLDKMSLDDHKVSGATLFSAGLSGVWLCWWWGRGAPCVNHFWTLEALLIFDSFLFSWAYWKGEGGGLLWRLGLA
jgi:hypothetical protein